MRTFASLALVATWIGVDALSLVERTDGSAPRVVHQPIRRNSIRNPLENDRIRLRKRQSSSGTVQGTLENEETLYYLDVSIGTPAQKLQLQIDTGSSDLWVNVANSQLCESQGSPCSQAGTYSGNDSSTYKYLDSNFNITYVDGSGSSGDYVTDTVEVAGVTLQRQQFGIGYESNSQNGVLGIGYPVNEVAVEYNGGNSYPNVPQSLVNVGAINTNAYSVWLNDLNSAQGSILFGGVNSAKYTGSLQTVPIIKEEGTYAEFVIALTAVGANGTVGSIVNNIAVPALLDSGSSLMYLPDSTFSSILSAIPNSQYSSQEGAAFVPCSLANSDQSLDFTFSGATISVALSELIIDAGEQRGQELCILGIGPTGGSTPVLGDTFIRSAYIVYDLDANEISLAQTDFNSSSNHILEITTGSGVPGATPVGSPVTAVTGDASAGARIGGYPSGAVSSGLAAPTAAVGYGGVVLGTAFGALVLAL